METPRRLGRYELLEQLGEGGMGAVWLARLTGAAGFEKLCIVKTVLPAIAKDKAFVSRFLHEGRVLTQLVHSNIAQVLDMGDEGGALFIALEYVAGTDLSRLHQHVVEKGQTLPVPVAVYLVQQAAEGLGAAHRKTNLDGTPLNVVHRDVSPHNIMVSYDGEVKVIDFGIAKSDARSQATGTPTVMGKLGYLAPEQARGESVDHRADQYSLGIVLWELLTNESFVPRGTLTEMVVAMANPTPRTLGALANVPPSLESVLSRALHPQASQRFPTTEDFSRALLDELLKLSGMPSKVQIGEFVKQFCSTEFQATQALLSRIATMRGVPPAAGFEPTALTPLPPGVSTSKMPSPHTDVPMTTAQLQAAAVPPSKLPLVVGAGLALTLLVGAGIFFSRPANPPATTATETLPPVSPVEPAPNTPPEPPLQAAVVPPVAEAVKAAPGDNVDAKKTAELFLDGDKTYVRAGQSDGLTVGTTLVMVGAPGADGKRQQVGTATVMEVFPKMARVALDGAAAAAQGPRFAALGEVKVVPAPPAPAPAGTVEVKRVAELFKDGDKTYARAGQSDGLVVGQTLVVVAAADASGRRAKLGTSTVMEIFPKMTRLALDEKAAGASGERFVALGDVKEAVAPSAGMVVNKAAELFADGANMYVRAGKTDGLVAGQELVIVGPAQSDGKSLKVGTATVMDVQAKISRVLLDEGAAKAEGARRAVLGGAGEKPSAEPAPTGGKGQMMGGLQLQQQPIWAVFLQNKSKFEWRKCTLLAPGQRRMAFPSLSPGARREFAINSFVFDPTTPNLVNEVEVKCKEGTIRIPAQ